MHEQLAELLPSVYRFALHLCGNQHEAEDLAQEAMLRGLRNWTTLSDQRALRTWLYRITRNLWIDSCRKRNRHPVQQPVSLESVIAPARSQSWSAEINEQIEQALLAMKLLPDRQRAVLHLIACEQLSITEAATVLEITPQAVKASLSLARSHMRERTKRVPEQK